MIDGNDPQGTATDTVLDDEASQTAAIEALLGDPEEDDAQNNESATGGDEPNGDDNQGDAPEGASDDATTDADAATGDQSDVTVTLSDGRTLNRKQIEAAVRAEADLKAALTPKFQEAAAMRRQAEQERQAISQQKAVLDQYLPLVTQALTELVGEPATEEDYQRDFIAATAKERAYQRNVAKLQQLQQAQQYQQQTSQAETTQQMREKKIAMRDALFSRRAELKDPAAFQKYESELVQTLVHYGFEPGDEAKIVDDRILRAFEDAARYRAIQANKSKAEVKGTNVPPVAKPGVRQSNNTRAEVRAKAMSKLRSSGDPALADALLADLV